MNRRRPMFVLDTNAYIEVHRRYYSLDLCPGFWECLLPYCGESQVRSIDRVRNEIVSDSNQTEDGISNPDLLSDWVRQATTDLFVSSAEPTVTATYVDMSLWVQTNQQFQPQAKENFAREADGWVAAYAKVNNRIVVTQEMFSANVKRRVPLPNVCHQFGVKYCNTFEMLRELEVRFYWIR